MLCITTIGERLEFVVRHASLHRQLASLLGMKVAVLEDGPVNPETVRVCAEFGYYYRATGYRRYGPSYSRNLGLVLSDDAHVFFIDSEIVPTKRALFLIRDEVASYGSKPIFFRYDFVGDDGVFQYADGRIRNEEKFIYGNHPAIVDPHDSWSGAIWYPKELVLKAGGFSIDFDGCWGHEDTDLGSRLWAMGVKARWSPYARFLHYHHEDSGQWKRWDTGNEDRVMGRREDFLRKGAEGVRSFTENTGDLTDRHWDFAPEEK